MSFLLLGMFAFLLAVGTSALVHADKEASAKTGASIYKQQCASCHGAKGEGNAKESIGPLMGKRSVEQLTKYIERRMPEDDPKRCVGDDAAKVAQYIYDEFYSEIAQARNRPPRIDLSRLTVPQHQQVLADVIGAFRFPAKWSDDRGLRGQYYDSRRMGRKPKFERRDGVVNLELGKESAFPGKIDPKEFAMRWQGAVLAPVTGDYEFVVETDNACKLWVNDLKNPLIDVWVKSGKDTKFTGIIKLLGGRPYNIRLDYFKSTKEKTASVRLLWKVPGKDFEVIPERQLSPVRVPEVFVLETSFPPDDRSVGYERGTSVSQTWVSAVTNAAIETANYVSANLPELSRTEANDKERAKKLQEFASRFAELAFRRPLTANEKEILVSKQFQNTKNADLALKRSILLALSSPRFLYRELGQGNDSYDVASRISFALWDSLPDAQLLQAAANNQLKSKEQVRAHVVRILPDLRTKAKIRQFLLHWLHVEQPPDLAKDPKKFAKFTDAIAGDLRTSLELALDEAVWQKSSDFRDLLLADTMFVNKRLAEYYDLPVPESNDFVSVRVDSNKHAGVLAHPYLMATHSYTATSSPIHRGVFLLRGVLGRTLRPPPAAFAPLAPDLHPNLNTRERVALQTKPQDCMNCHAVINPLGFTLEHYDADGRFRREEKNRPIDATGEYETRNGTTVKFSGVRELGQFLAKSEEVHDAFVEQLFQHLIRQPIQAYGLEKLPGLRQQFVQSDYNIRRLVTDIVTEGAFVPEEK